MGLLLFCDNKPGCSSEGKLNVSDGCIDESQDLRSGRYLTAARHPIQVPGHRDEES
jgi:hypothetical protein